MFHPIQIPFGCVMLFKEEFSALADFCDETYEVGYEMLWQGVPEDA